MPNLSANSIITPESLKQTRNREGEHLACLQNLFSDYNANGETWNRFSHRIKNEKLKTPSTRPESLRSFQKTAHNCLKGAHKDFYLAALSTTLVADSVIEALQDNPSTDQKRAGARFALTVFNAFTSITPPRIIPASFNDQSLMPGITDQFLTIVTGSFSDNGALDRLSKLPDLKTPNSLWAKFNNTQKRILSFASFPLSDDPCYKRPQPVADFEMTPDDHQAVTSNCMVLSSLMISFSACLNGAAFSVLQGSAAASLYESKGNHDIQSPENRLAQMFRVSVAGDIPGLLHLSEKSLQAEKSLPPFHPA